MGSEVTARLRAPGDNSAVICHCGGCAAGEVETHLSSSGFPGQRVPHTALWADGHVGPATSPGPTDCNNARAPGPPAG